MSLATKIVLALVLGVLCGLFFGEPMGVLDPVGYAFVKLLQMTVLPYVIVSLIAGLGHLTYEQAGRLAVRGGVLVLLIWTITFAIVVAMPLTFPSRETASFFSTSLVKPRAELDFIALYIPSNPFQSLANSVVPAVVLFSIAVGIALIGVERKGIFVENLSILADALMRVASFIIRLMPFGVFAIAASTAGTMTVEEFASVQVYLVTFVAFAILMTFWILPGLVTSLTSLRCRDVVGLTRDALVTAFATGSYFVVLPLLAERSKQLLGYCQLDRQESEPLVDVIIPVSYNFPHAAKVLSLSFLLFAGWFSGATVSAEQYPTLAFSRIISMFASTSLAVPFLLDLLRIPEDMFQLFIAMSVVNARFGAMLSAMYTLTLTLLGTCAMAGILTARWGRLFRYVLVTVALTLVIIAGTRALLGSLHDTSYRKDQIIAEMHLLEEPVPATVYDSSADALPAPDPNQPRLEAIRERGTLRVGYIPDRLPFSYLRARRL